MTTAKRAGLVGEIAQAAEAPRDRLALLTPASAKVGALRLLRSNLKSAERPVACMLFDDRHPAGSAYLKIRQ